MTTTASDPADNSLRDRAGSGSTVKIGCSVWSGHTSHARTTMAFEEGVPDAGVLDRRYEFLFETTPVCPRARTRRCRGVQPASSTPACLAVVARLHRRCHRPGRTRERTAGTLISMVAPTFHGEYFCRRVGPADRVAMNRLGFQLA